MSVFLGFVQRWFQQGLFFREAIHTTILKCYGFDADVKGTEILSKVGREKWVRLSLRVTGEFFSWLVGHIVSKCQDLRKGLKSSCPAASQLYCQWFLDSSCSGLESEAEHGKWT